MAQNLKVEITQGESNIPEMPVPWNVKAEWLTQQEVEKLAENQEADGPEIFETVIEFLPIRTWSFDVPSELVAKTIQTAFNNMTDETFDTLMNSGYEV